VPSQLRALLTTIDLNGIPDLSSLRFLLVTGEALPPELCRQWLDLFPLIPLVNAYGPTECSDDVTHHFIRSVSATKAASTPIGRPIQNMQVYVLNRELRPAPIGVTGEIYVGGIGVGRGYVYDAKRTAEVYLPDPFSKQGGARLYYTGDLGCYLPDGSIQFNGRRDHQVKIRGFRIELGEIEAALRAHPGVQDAIVVADEGRLIAYAVAAEVTKKELRQFVRGRLPEHMVPSEFVVVDKFPLNRNGKVDRNALPRPVLDRTTDEDFLPPSTNIEKTLASIWAKNLKLTQVSLSDNFFDLGGNSLLSIQVLNQIRSELSVDLPMRTLLESATLGELAGEITDQCQNNATAFATQR
jgi:acyl-coenzyme A synthetase/AMP-(fatty) acid ligase/acyl carrier protein